MFSWAKVKNIYSLLQPSVSLDSNTISKQKKWWKDWFKKKTPTLPGNLIAPKELVPEKKLGINGQAAIESYASNMVYPNQLVPQAICEVPGCQHCYHR